MNAQMIAALAPAIQPLMKQGLGQLDDKLDGMLRLLARNAAQQDRIIELLEALVRQRV